MEFDVVVYCPLEEEFEVVSPLFEFQEDLTEKLGRVALVSVVSGVRVLVMCGGTMGPAAAQKAARDVAKCAKVRLFVCLGICGGISSDLKLGDVCGTGVNYDVTNNGKETDGGTELSPYPFRTKPEISRAFTYFKSHPQLKASKDSWEALCVQYISDLLPARIWEEQCGKVPTFYSGAIATGPVSASQKFNKKLKKIDRKMLAIETEVGGVFREFEEDPTTSVMTIRGVSDLADSQKASLEKVSKNVYRKYAAYVAGTFLLANLESNEFLRKHLVDTGQGVLELEPPCEIDETVENIDRVYEAARIRLKGVSPEFKGQAETYWVPAPRLRRPDAAMQNNTGNLDISEAIEEAGHIVVQVPISYPDRGLAHLYTSELCGKMTDGKAYFPIFCECQNFSPPKKIEKLFQDISEIEFQKLREREDFEVVLLVENLNINNDKIVSHFVSEISRLGFDRVVIIMHEADYADSIEYSVDLGNFSFYNVADISFCNIAKYLKLHFGYEPIGAEALALRLTQTFEDFDLIAHPSYFAGIPKDVLQKIVTANRRVELIELAVLGYLTFTVMTDQSATALSRSTRYRFLTELVVAMDIHGDDVSDEDLLRRAKDMIEGRALPVRPEVFLSGFYENGILRSNVGKVEFTIPFIRSFILADFLSKNLDYAKKYFNISSEYFDFAAFQMYAEMTEADFFAVQALELISEDIEEFKVILGEHVADRKGAIFHALENPEIAPAMLRTQAGIAKAKRQVLATADQMLLSEDESQKKQDLLDISRVVQARSMESAASFSESNVYAAKRKVVRDWAVGLTILGGGCEQIDGKIKLRLSEAMIKLSSLIIDDYYYMIANTDYREIKGDVYNHILENEEILEKISSQEDVRDFVGFLVDLLEMARWSSVLPSIIGRMNELACSGALKPSIMSTELNNISEELIRALWISSIDSSEGYELIRKIIKKFPKKAFPRVTIANYLIERAYWNSGSEGDRINILAAAEEVVKPIAVDQNLSNVFAEIKEAAKN